MIAWNNYSAGRRKKGVYPYLPCSDAMSNQTAEREPNLALDLLCLGESLAAAAAQQKQCEEWCICCLLALHV